MWVTEIRVQKLSRSVIYGHVAASPSTYGLNSMTLTVQYTPTMYVWTTHTHTFSVNTHHMYWYFPLLLRPYLQVSVMLAFTGIFRWKCQVKAWGVVDASKRLACQSQGMKGPFPQLYIQHTHEPTEPTPQLTHNKLCPCLTDNTCLWVV